VLAFPFVFGGESREYLSRAFDFGRQFLFKWTVNWRFVGEEVFLSRKFAYSLLVAHVGILLLFLQTRWVSPSSSGIVKFIRRYTRSPNAEIQGRISESITPVFVMDAMLASMAIGLLCARSLHYQFYAYIAWATPYLLWKSGLGPVWVLGNWAMQEIAWLTYPSTNFSSGTVISQLVLAIASLWWGSGRPPTWSSAAPGVAEKRHTK
jgi:alpha-1,3-mannosyltransferase